MLSAVNPRTRQRAFLLLTAVLTVCFALGGTGAARADPEATVSLTITPPTASTDGGGISTTATATVEGTNLSATGLVEFTIAGVIVPWTAPLTLNADGTEGTATVTISGLPQDATLQLQASYYTSSGAIFDDGESNFVTVTVATPAAAVPVVNLAYSPELVVADQPVTLTATVSVPGSTAIPQGTVVFSASGTDSNFVPFPQTATVGSDGTATIVTAGYQAGPEWFEAQFTGGSDYAAVTSSAVLVNVQPAQNAPPSQPTVTITAPSPTISYGSAINAQLLSPAVDPSNVTTTAPTCSTSATASSPVGTYPVTCSGAVAPNYTIVYDPGTLTIDPAPVTVNVPSATMVYGASLPSLTPTYTPANPNLTTFATCTTTATTASSVGSYLVTCSGAASTNYAITYANTAGTSTSGTLTVTAKGLTETPPSVTIAPGAAIPTLTPTFSGFVNGDTSAVVSGATCTTLATSSSAAGTYPITCTAGTATNYTVTVAGQGTLTIQASTPTTLIDWNIGPVQSGQQVALAATLLAGLMPVKGETITLTLGTQSCTAVTNILGTAVCLVTATGPLGPTTSTATFAGDGKYRASSDSNPVLLYALPSGPNGCGFVIGDRSDSGHITFWGPQWGKDNSFSHGSAPSGFSGFAGSQSSSGWSSSGSPAPSTLPSYIAVLVTSSPGKHGSSFSGDVAHIVIVKTDPGYNGNANVAGTGTVVATLS
jgi:hypothetical protein